MNQQKLFNNLTDKEVDDMFKGFWRDDDDEPENGPPCECGADKTYGKYNKAHSNWCPKYEKKSDKWT